MNDTKKLGEFINEARTMGIEVLPPDVNESQVAFAPARNGQVIRFGMAAIKGVGEIAVQSLLDARRSGGDFKSLTDMCERVDIRTVNRKVLEALIKSGACDTFKETRATLFAQIDRTLTRAAGIIQDRQRGQSSMFGMLEENTARREQAVSRLEEWPQHELLAAEKELLGFYVTGHPLTPYVPLLQRYALTNTAGLGQLANRSLTRIGGLIAAVQQGVSKKSGKPYAMVTLEDLEGSVQVLCMNENYDKYRELLKLNQAILVVAEVNLGDDKPKLFSQEIMPLDEAPRKYTRQVHFRLHTGRLDPENLLSVQELALAHPGKCPLFLCFTRPTGEIIFIEAHEKFAVAPSLELQRSADQRFGQETYYAKVDMTPPERVQRPWERRNGANGEE
jgi:DNA polymerase-3 subunit alpha